MADKQDQLKEALDAFAKTPGCLGGILVGRDGIVVLNQLSKLPAAETFSAMSATLVAAAETALGEMGASGAKRVLIEAEGMRLVAVGCDADVLLIGSFNGAGSLDAALASTEKTAQGIGAILRG